MNFKKLFILRETRKKKTQKEKDMMMTDREDEKRIPLLDTVAMRLLSMKSCIFCSMRYSIQAPWLNA
jgi:hypothetical protein